MTEYLPAADTLPVLNDSIPAVTDTLSMGIWDSAAVYGTESVRIAETAVETAAGLGPMAGNTWVQMLSLIVLCLWCWMIYWFRDQVSICLKSLVKFKSEDKHTAEHGHLYNGFVNFAAGVMIAAAGIMVVKTASDTVDVQQLSMLPGWFTPTAAILVAVLVAAVTALKFVILELAGKLTFSEEMTGKLVQAKKSHIAAVAALAVPPILLYSGLNPIWDGVLVYIIVIEVVAVVAIFVIKTCILFVQQKVSLLIWFLYLCAVEILPLSLAVLLVVKNV